MEYTIVAKPDGTIEVVPITQNNNLPFNVGERLFNEFNIRLFINVLSGRLIL